MIRSLAGSIYVFLKTLLFFEWCYQINGMDLFSWHITLNCFHSFNCALYGNVKLGQSDEDQGRRLKNAYINRARRMRMRQGKVMICHWWREKYFVMSRKNPWGGGGFATALSQLPSADSNSNQRGSILRGEGIKKREKKKKKKKKRLYKYIRQRQPWRQHLNSVRTSWFLMFWVLICYSYLGLDCNYLY